jgi:hypothetical protein
LGADDFPFFLSFFLVIRTCEYIIVFLNYTARISEPILFCLRLCRQFIPLARATCPASISGFILESETTIIISGWNELGSHGKLNLANLDEVLSIKKKSRRNTDPVSSSAKMNAETSRKPKSTVKESRNDILHDDLLLRAVMGLENRRNRQRDAGIPKIRQHESSRSLPNLNVRRPQSTPIPSTSRSVHARITTDPSARERPPSDPLPRDMSRKPSTSTLPTSSPLGVPSEGLPPPYEPTDWDAFLSRVTEDPESATYDVWKFHNSL